MFEASRQPEAMLSSTRCRCYLVEALSDRLWKAPSCGSIVTIRAGAAFPYRQIIATGVRTADEALAHLDGRAYISASEACQSVEVGTAMENDALGVFLLALREANIRFTSI